MNDPFLIDVPDTLTPVEAAAASLAADRMDPIATIRYSSRGRLLVLGNPEAVDAVLGSLPKSLDASVALAGPCPPELSAKLNRRRMRVLDSLSGMDIFGWLGKFRLAAGALTSVEGSAPGSFFRDGEFDLVLDLLEPPIARRPNPPIGYFSATPSDPEQLEEALAQLPHWVGDFDKPQYFQFEPGLCDHRSGGTETCRRCFDACGTWAISKDENQITVNPYLCQGCGDCAMVCPTGAIVFNYPTPQRMLVRIERMLDAYFDHGGKVPVLLLHDASRGQAWLDDHRKLLPVNVLPFQVEALGAAGVEIWLMALALGAAEVVLLDAGALSDKTRALICSEMEWCRAVLAALGFGPQILRMVSTREMLKASVPVRPFQPLEPLATWTDHADKRTLVREAIEHLRRQTASPDFSRLPPGAPFGTVQIDVEGCTLCMKCIPVCPETALIGDPANKRLAFVEASCIQCGGCVSICPENAVTLQPRYAFDLDSIAAVRPLVQKQGLALHQEARGKP